MSLSVSRKYKTLLRARLLVCACPAIFIFIILYGSYTLFASIGIAVSVTAVLVVFCFYIPLYVKSCCVTLFDSAVSVSKGVIFKRKFILPEPSTLFGEAVQTPLSALLDIKTVRIYSVRRALSVGWLGTADAQLLLDRFAR